MDSKKLKILIAVIAVTLIALLASFNSFKSQSDFGLTAEEFRDAYNSSSFDNSKIIYVEKENSKYRSAYRLDVDNGVEIYAYPDELNNKITHLELMIEKKGNILLGDKDFNTVLESTLKKVLYCTSKFNMFEFDEVNKTLNNGEYFGLYLTKTGISINIDKRDIDGSIGNSIFVTLNKHSL